MCTYIHTYMHAYTVGIKHGDLYYRLSDIEKFSAEALLELVQAFFAGKLQPTEKVCMYVYVLYLHICILLSCDLFLIYEISTTSSVAHSSATQG